MLEITNLVKRYGHNEAVLKGLDLKVEDNSVVSIVGASGAGKSTMLRCINRLVEPTSGSIKLNGTELVNVKGAELRRAGAKLAWSSRDLTYLIASPSWRTYWLGGLATLISIKQSRVATLKPI